MDQSMWQTFGAFDFLHSSHRWLQAILLCGKHSTTMQTKIVSRLWFYRRPWRFQVNIRRNSVYFRKSNVRANELDVQETDFSLTQFYRRWSYFSRCRFVHGWDSRSRSLGFSDWSIFIPHQTNKTKDVRESRGNLSANTQPNMRKQIPATNTNLHLTNIDHVPSIGTHSGSNSMMYVFEDNETVIEMRIGRRHVSRTHRVALDWLFDRINLEPKIHINFVDAQKLADIPIKGSFSRDEWNHLLRLFTRCSLAAIWAILFLIRPESRAPCQREVTKRLPVKVHRWRNQNQLFQRRRDPSTWCYAALGARGKILRKTWDIPSIQGTTMKDKVITLVQGDLYGPPKTQKSNVLKWEDRKMLKVLICGNSLMRMYLRTLPVQGDLCRQRLQEQSFKTWSTQTINTLRRSSISYKRSWALQQATQHSQWKH